MLVIVKVIMEVTKVRYLDDKRQERIARFVFLKDRARPAARLP
jgi:hypothetical protein